MSHSLFKQASAVIPGGVNSPARSFKSVGGEPVFISNARGPYIYDQAGRPYIDYVGSWGPMILGHNHPEVIEATVKAVQAGLSFGAPCEQETLLAQTVCDMVPSMEKVRFVNSGTEATMSAIRVARAATGRNKIIKFEGCYHGHHDGLLVKAGSGAMTLGEPSSPGVPKGFTQYTLTAQFNDLDSVNELFSTHGDSIAAIIVEPVAGNMGCIPPEPGFLEGLRAVCDAHGSLLIFDEVMSGFRVAQGGAQALYEVTPDLTALGKIVGGGMPVGAFGGRADIMNQLAPEGPVYQAGTLAGHPVGMASGLATLKLIQADPSFYERINDKAVRLAEGIHRQAELAGQPLVVNQVGGMLSLFFTDQNAVTTYHAVARSQTQLFPHYFHTLLAQGIYWAPSAYECAFISNAHDDALLEITLNAIGEAMKTLRVSR